MWLSQEQIMKEFYITIECAKTPCSFVLTLEGKSSAELYLNEQYTYYVTKENKEMNFKLLKSSTINLRMNSYASVWARGNKEIKSRLEGGQYDKLTDDYCFYEMGYKYFQSSNYNLIIEGKIGDMINVGFILFNCDSLPYNYLPYNPLPSCNSEYKLENGEEVTSYLEPHISEIYSAKNPTGVNLGYFYDFRLIPFKKCSHIYEWGCQYKR